MFVNTQQIQLGATKYIEHELGQKAVGFNKFAVYFALPIVNDKIVKYVESYSENQLTKDFFDENKNVDIDRVYNMAKNAIQKSGKFMLYGIMFEESDIDKLYGYIKGDLV